MFRSFIKIACLTFACVMTGYIAAAIEYGSHGSLDLRDYIGTAQAQEMSVDEPAIDTAVQPIAVNGITYITGGIGDEERDDFEARKNKYNFHLMVTAEDGTFTGDDILSVTTAKGVVLLPPVDAGPLFYATLTPGAYKFSLSRNGKTKEMTVVIRPSKPVYLRVSL